MHGEYVIDRACMEAIQLTDHSECRYKPNDPLMHCTGLKLTKIKDCERLEAKK